MLDQIGETETYEIGGIDYCLSKPVTIPKIWFQEHRSLGHVVLVFGAFMSGIGIPAYFGTAEVSIVLIGVCTLGAFLILILNVIPGRAPRTRSTVRVEYFPRLLDRQLDFGVFEQTRQMLRFSGELSAFEIGATDIESCELKGKVLKIRLYPNGSIPAQIIRISGRGPFEKEGASLEELLTRLRALEPSEETSMRPPLYLGSNFPVPSSRSDRIFYVFLLLSVYLVIGGLNHPRYGIPSNHPVSIVIFSGTILLGLMTARRSLEKSTVFKSLRRWDVPEPVLVSMTYYPDGTEDS